MASSLRPLVSIASVLLPALAALSSCGGGGGAADPGGGGTPTGASASLFFDTAAGIDAEVEGLLAAVTVEQVDGSISGNLLAAGSTVVELARPDGVGDLVGLRGVPRGACVALHLLFADGSLRARLADGRTAVVTPRSHALRIELGRPWIVGERPARLALRHGAPMTLTSGAGGSMTWHEEIDAVPTDVIPIRFGRVEVVAVDRQAGSIDGLLTSMDDRPIALTFAADPLLLREPSLTPLTEAAFFDGLEVGSRLLVDGLLDLDDELIATTAVDLGADDPIGNGQKGEIEARIIEILPGRDACRVSVLEVQKGAHLLSSSSPQTLVIDAATARIKWVPRRGRHPGHLAFSDLEEGMVVEVSWHGAASGDEIDADKIDIRSQGNCYDRAFDGEVLAVSTSPRRLTIRLPEAVIIDGRELTELEIDVAEEVPIIRESGSSLRFVDLGDIVVGETANVLLDARGRGRFRASLIVLDWQ